MNFDIFLVAAYKDINKLPYCLKALTKNISGYENIYLCTPTELDSDFVASLHYPIHYRTDLKALPAHPYKWRYRPNWIYQQFIKLFQNETKNDWYFVCDVDTIINRPLSLWENGKPIHYYGWDQNNTPYYKFNKKMLGYERVISHTCLSDTGFYNKEVVRKMLTCIGHTVDSFLYKTYQIINKECYPSEPDLYFNWQAKYLPDMYVFKRLKTKCNAREGKDPFIQLWDNQSIEDLMIRMSKKELDTYSMHSWIDVSHNKWR